MGVPRQHGCKLNNPALLPWKVSKFRGYSPRCLQTGLSGHENCFLSVDHKNNLVLDREGFLGSGLEKIEERVGVIVRRSDSSGVNGMAFPQTVVIAKTGEHQYDVLTD